MLENGRSELNRLQNRSGYVFFFYLRFLEDVGHCYPRLVFISFINRLACL